jgi:hypothetical protein
VGWVVGLGMIAWDLIDGGDGPLSSIEEQLTSEEVKQEIRREIVLTIEQELPLANAEIAREIANEVYYQWRDFKDSFQTVLTVADQDPDFNQFLGSVATDRFYKLSQLADTAGEDELQSAFHDGSLERVLALPEASLQILSTTGSIQTVIAWSELARSSLNDVVELEIYRHKQPEDFTADTLQRLLRTNDATTISKLILLDRADMENVLSISVANINALAQRLSAEDFNYLSWFMARLDQNATNFLISSWLEKPEAISRFKSETVQNGIVESRSRVQAIRFVAAESSLWTLYQDLPRVISRNIASKLFFAKYGIDQIVFFVIVSLFVVVVVALLVRFLVRSLLFRQS